MGGVWGLGGHVVEMGFNLRDQLLDGHAVNHWWFRSKALAGMTQYEFDKLVHTAEGNTAVAEFGKPADCRKVDASFYIRGCSPSFRSGLSNSSLGLLVQLEVLDQFSLHAAGKLVVGSVLGESGL